MSNAAVINATNSSGLSAGSPITIETGGDVKFVAAGKFTGVGFVTLAFAPYSGGKAGVPTLITITNEIPLKRTSAIGTGATQFVGWVADSSGTWEATGIAIGDSDGEALSDDLGTFPDVASLPTKALRVGATCKVAGVLQVWDGSAWAAMGGGILASSAARLSRPILVATFGDSTAFVTPSNYAADISTVSAMPITIPGSGQTSAAINTTKMIGVLQAPLLRYVGDFGISGQDTNGMLARSSGTYSATRKAIGDLTRVSPDVVIMRGGSVNDVSPMDTTTPQANVDAVAARHIAIVKKILSLGYPVIDSGILGYDGNGSVPAPRLAFIRAAIVRINSLINSGLAGLSGYTFINPEGLTSISGAFIANVSSDGTHLSAYGAGVVAQAQNSALAAIFSPNVDGICVSEFEADWANPSGGRPANLTASNAGSTDLVSATTNGILSVSFNSSASGKGPKLALGDLLQNMSALSSGDKFSVRWKLELRNSLGDKVIANPLFEIFMYESTNVGDFYINLSAMDVGDGDVLVNTPIFIMDRAGSSLGSSSRLQITVLAPAAGSYILTAYPPQIIKH